MGARALIGHTGFVGGNLLRQWSFDERFARSNVESITGRSYQTVVCAGAPAAKWIANREPEADRANIERLARALEGVRCASFILISTIDVYPRTRGEDEGFDCSSLENHPYGTNRSWLEQRVRTLFPDALIARLPALFGRGLKKNVLFDLIHRHQLDRIQPMATFQWYDLERLGTDLVTAQEHGLKLVNLFTEPICTAELVDELFPGVQLGGAVQDAPHYALATRHAALFGGRDGYVQDRKSVFSALHRFVASVSR